MCGIGCRQADVISAKALLESITIQGQLYDEWMEVMSDYATVFSHDRGVPEAVDSVSGGSAAVRIVL